MSTTLGAVCICTMLGAMTITNTVKEVTYLLGTAITGLQQSLIFLIDEIWGFPSLS